MKYIGIYELIEKDTCDNKYYLILTKTKVARTGYVSITKKISKTNYEAVANAVIKIEYDNLNKTEVSKYVFRFEIFPTDELFELSEDEILKHVIANSL